MLKILKPVKMTVGKKWTRLRAAFFSCSLCIESWSPGGATVQDDPVKSAAFPTYLRERGKVHRQILQRGIWYFMVVSQMTRISFTMTRLNSFMEQSLTLIPSCCCSGHWGILFVIQDLFPLSTGRWSRAWSPAALWHSTLISIGGTTSIRTGTEQKSIKPMPYPCWRAGKQAWYHHWVFIFSP